jgi:hypothetical protein
MLQYTELKIDRKYLKNCLVAILHLINDFPYNVQEVYIPCQVKV